MNFYRQNFDGCRTGTIGDQGMTDADFETFLHQAAKGVDWIRQAHGKREWPVLVLPEERRDSPQRDIRRRCHPSYGVSRRPT